MTPWERKLWSALRNRRVGGLKFRRQFKIGQYVVDFCNLENKLIIELDGGQHDFEEDRIKDITRQKFLESQGYKVFRFWNNEVVGNLEGIIDVVLQSSQPHPNPLPNGRGRRKFMIILVAAIAKNNVIGRENDLPWYLPEDLKRFRKLTTGKTVLMGRRTFDSIMKRLGKPLPNRKNVVVTRDKNFNAPEGVEIYHSLDEALAKYRSEDLFIIGGGQIYKQTIDKADALYITHVDKVIEGDVYFPEIEPARWKKVEEEKHEGFSFTTYKRFS